MIIRILSCDEKSAAAGDDVKESSCVSQLPEFKEMHVKIFNTGKLEIPGIQNIQTLNYVTQRLRRCGADNIILFLDACRNENDFTF